jgi:hypothetical protein
MSYSPTTESNSPTPSVELFINSAPINHDCCFNNTNKPSFSPRLTIEKYNYNDYYNQHASNQGMFYKNEPDITRQYQFENSTFNSYTTQIFPNYSESDRAFKNSTDEYFTSDNDSSKNDMPPFDSTMSPHQPSKRKKEPKHELTDNSATSKLFIKNESTEKNEVSNNTTAPIQNQKDVFLHVSNNISLPETATSKLKEWYSVHISHPYPTSADKKSLALICGISTKQVNSWFCNKRNRSDNTKPKRVKMQLKQELKKVYHELVKNPNNSLVIENFRSTLLMNNIEID